MTNLKLSPLYKTLKILPVVLILLFMTYCLESNALAATTNNEVAEIRLNEFKADIYIIKPANRFYFQADYLLNNNRLLLTNNDITNLLNLTNTDADIAYSTSQNPDWPGAHVEKSRNNNWEQIFFFTDGYTNCSIEYSEKTDEFCEVEPAVWVSQYNNEKFDIIAEWHRHGENKLSDGRVFIPLRFVLEKLGYSLSYSENTITIYSAKK